MRFNQSRSNKDNNGLYQENNQGSAFSKSSITSAKAALSDINNLIVVGIIKVDEHSRLTFSKRIKSVFPILPGDTIVVYQDFTNNDLLFKVQRFNEISDTWIVKRKKDIILPFSDTNTLKGISNKIRINPDNQHSQNRQHLQQQPQSKNVINIMIVDDDPDTVEAFKSLILDFNNEGDGRQYNIDTFTSSIDALKQFLDVNSTNKEEDSSFDYDLVIIDVKMPEINGVQLYQILHIIDRYVKVLFVSAMDTAGDLAGILPGVKPEDIFKKPFNAQSFNLKVQEKINS